MPYELKLPAELAKQGWKLKIFDKERLEPPHVTVIRRQNRWRWGLREGAFLDSKPDPKDVPKEVIGLVQQHWDDLCKQWDAMYPLNPVDGSEDDDD